MELIGKREQARSNVAPLSTHLKSGGSTKKKGKDEGERVRDRTDPLVEQEEPSCGVPPT